MEVNVNINLNGNWKIYSFCGTYKLEGKVPGTLFESLEKSGYWGDKSVFWRDNNRKCRDIANRNFTFSREFELDSEFISNHEKIILDADGLDTLAVIRINDVEIARTENMHRRYQFDVSDALRCGGNTIEIDFLNRVC